MQRKSKSTEEPWLLSYADLITNLLIFFVMILSASSISKSKMQEISKKVSGKEQSDSLSAIQKKIEENIKKENSVRAKVIKSLSNCNGYWGSKVIISRADLRKILKMK